MAFTAPSSYGHTLRTRIARHVDPGSVVYTDDGAATARSMTRTYTHRTINHTAPRVRPGRRHTQTIEGFFSLVKNGIRGVYHGVSSKCATLQSYLNEYAWRYNHGDDPRAMFERLLQRSAAS